MKKIILIFTLLFQSSSLLSMDNDPCFNEDELFLLKVANPFADNELEFLNELDFLFAQQYEDNSLEPQNDSVVYKEELLDQRATTTTEEEHSPNAEKVKNQPQKDTTSKKRKPSQPSRPKKLCPYPECSLLVTKNRFNDHLMRAHSKCPWCDFNGNNRKELIEHLHEVTSVKNVNHNEAAYFCFSCKKFVTTYLSDFKKHGCYDK